MKKYRFLAACIVLIYLSFSFTSCSHRLYKQDSDDITGAWIWCNIDGTPRLNPTDNKYAARYKVFTKAHYYITDHRARAGYKIMGSYTYKKGIIIENILSFKGSGLSKNIWEYKMKTEKGMMFMYDINDSKLKEVWKKVSN